jgi:hypothetical protein
MSTYVKIKECYFKRDNNIAVDIRVLFQCPFPFLEEMIKEKIMGIHVYVMF